MKRAVPDPTEAAKNMKVISASKISLKEHSTSAPLRDLQPSIPEWERNAHITFGCGSQWGFCHPRREEDLQEIQTSS